MKKLFIIALLIMPGAYFLFADDGSLKDDTVAIPEVVQEEVVPATNDIPEPVLTETQESSSASSDCSDTGCPDNAAH